MQIWRSLDDVPADLGRAVVTIGNFDGVHLGHVHVVSRAREVAARIGAEHVVAVTFDPHPMAVLRPDHMPVMIASVEDRLARLADAGADSALVIPFDREIATWTPQEFVDRVLVDALGVAAVVVGSNFRFGHRAAGDVALLGELGAERGFEVEGIALDGGPQVWSSTYVRQCLAAGDVTGAAEALGRPVSVRGVVIRGDQRGRELGFPTANVPIGRVAVPADGVYAGRLTRLDTGERFPAAISVGSNPTFAGQRDTRVEAYVLDRDDLELYDVEVEITFVDRVRGQIAFDGVESLVEAMHEDVRRIREVLAP